jgi:hypothetical protein
MRLSRPAALKTATVKADLEREAGNEEAGMSNGNTRSADEGSERYEICQ